MLSSAFIYGTRHNIFLLSWYAFVVYPVRVTSSISHFISIILQYNEWEILELPLAQFSQSQCNLIPQVHILIRQDPYIVKLMLYGFLVAQSEGGNFNFMKFLYRPHCIVFSSSEMPGSQISAAYPVNSLGNWSLIYYIFLKLRLLLVMELYDWRRHSRAALKVLWIGLNKMQEFLGWYGHQRRHCRAGKWGQKLIHQKRFETFIVLDRS